jgi:hypothetical protein
MTAIIGYLISSLIPLGIILIGARGAPALMPPWR